LSESSGESAFEELVRSGQRFKFGRNWAGFLRQLDDERIEEAERSLQDMLGVADMRGLRFLDIGSGSGLFSLSARRLGARVHSFDFDPDSVACTKSLRDRFFANDSNWHAESGSVLDREYLKSLGQFDVTYAWGVLHHTGAMWAAIDNAATTVRAGGLFYIMIYMDRGTRSRVWLRIKKFYCSGLFGRSLVLGVFIPYYVLRGALEDLVRLRNPISRYREYKRQRGMAKYHDWIDWLGGYPFEFATPAQLEEHLGRRGFVLQKRIEEEYLFRRVGEL
jgi:2-polyprenyl-3-methyl-5-hydroxy-6-metoxy-1,4-benzoquinol methylase